jgi:hypothetical protein
VSRRAGKGNARALRNLRHLEACASTSRALNLLAAWRRYRDDPEYAEKPFFRSAMLNRCFIVKHRYRPDERDLVLAGGASGTKIIMPFDPGDLAAGAHSFFVHQKGYDQFLDEVSGDGRIDARDAKLLELLHRLPSLDPFLMRERLKQSGFEPAQCYFDLTEADAEAMISFVREELTPLIGMSFGNVDAQMSGRVAKLAQKLMRNTGDRDLEPLRMGLSISKDDFEEAMFCWKGFIYYKWSLNRLIPQIKPVAAEIGSAMARGEVNADEERYIEQARGRLKQALAKACATVGATLTIYDHAYGELTRNGQPQAFRDFLLRAPALFHELGERLGAIQHILSFWRYRFPAGVRQQITGDELSDILADFEVSLNFDKAP